MTDTQTVAWIVQSSSDPKHIKLFWSEREAIHINFGHVSEPLYPASVVEALRAEIMHLAGALDAEQEHVMRYVMAQVWQARRWTGSNQQDAPRDWLTPTDHPVVEVRFWMPIPDFEIRRRAAGNIDV